MQMALIEDSQVVIGEGGGVGGEGMLYAGNGTNIIFSVVLRLGGIIHSGPLSPKHSRFA